MQELGVAPSARPPGPDVPLFESLLDSTNVLTLTSAVEHSFGIQIEDSEIVPANFSTLRLLADFVERKRHPVATQSAAI